MRKKKKKNQKKKKKKKKKKQVRPLAEQTRSKRRRQRRPMARATNVKEIAHRGRRHGYLSSLSLLLNGEKRMNISALFPRSLKSIGRWKNPVESKLKSEGRIVKRIFGLE